MAPSPLDRPKSKSPAPTLAQRKNSLNGSASEIHISKSLHYALSSPANSPAGNSTRSSHNALKSFDDLKENKSEKMKGAGKSSHGRKSPVPKKPWVSPSAKVSTGGSPNKRILAERNDSGSILGLPSPLRDAAGQPHFEKLALRTAASPASKEDPLADVAELHDRIQRFLDDQQALLHVTNAHPFNLDENNQSPTLSSCGSQEHHAAYHPVTSPFVPRPQFLRLQGPAVDATGVTSSKQNEGVQQKKSGDGQQDKEREGDSFDWKTNFSSFPLACGLNDGSESPGTTEGKASTVEKEIDSTSVTDKFAPSEKYGEEVGGEVGGNEGAEVLSTLEETIRLVPESVEKEMELSDDTSKLVSEKNGDEMDIVQEVLQTPPSAEAVFSGLEPTIKQVSDQGEAIAVKHMIEEDEQIYPKIKGPEEDKLDEPPYCILKENVCSVSSYPQPEFAGEASGKLRETLPALEEDHGELEDEGQDAVPVRNVVGGVLNFVLLAMFASAVVLSSGSSGLIPSSFGENHLSLIWHGSKYHESTLQFLKGMNGLWDAQLPASSYAPIDIRYFRQSYGVLWQGGDRFFQGTKKFITRQRAGRFLQAIKERAGTLLHLSEGHLNFMTQNFLFHARELAGNMKSWWGILSSWWEEETPSYEEDIQNLLAEWDLIQEFDLEAADEYFMGHLSENQREEIKSNLLRLTDAPEIQFVLSDLFRARWLTREDRFKFVEQFQVSGSLSNAWDNLAMEDGVASSINAGNKQKGEDFDSTIEGHDSLQAPIGETMNVDGKFEVAAEITARDSREAEEDESQDEFRFAESPKEESVENREEDAVENVGQLVGFTRALAMVEDVLEFGEGKTWELLECRDPNTTENLTHSGVEIGKDGRRVSAYTISNEDVVKKDGEARSETTASSEEPHAEIPALGDANADKVGLRFWVLIVMTAAIAAAPMGFLIARKQQPQKSAHLPRRGVEFLRKESQTRVLQERYHTVTPATTNSNTPVLRDEAEMINSPEPEAADSSPYGRFTTYRLVPKKEGQGSESKLTPVRRSSRLRNQVMSPKAARRIALSPP